MPLGLTLIEVQKVARRAEQLAVLKTFAEGDVPLTRRRVG